MSKNITLVFMMGLLISSLVMINFVFAQSIPEPSVPEFSAKAVATTIEVTIKNQLLTAYENGSYPNLYYMFRFKDHNASNGFWYTDPIYFVLPSTYGGYYEASDSDFTAISLSLKGYYFPSGQIDIQAMALVGTQYPTNMQNGTVYGFEGVISGWSNAQTLAIGENLNPTPSPSVKPQLTDQEVIIGVAITIAVIGAGLGLLVYLIKRK
jgi:hypothetical protein